MRRREDRDCSRRDRLDGTRLYQTARGNERELVSGKATPSVRVLGASRPDHRLLGRHARTPSGVALRISSVPAHGGSAG